MDGSTVEVITSKGCSKLMVGFTNSMPSFRVLQSFEPSVSSSPSSAASLQSGPFSGLIICVTGLSKEARKQVMDATKRLGGQYSPNLHPQCTHLVVQSSGGRKFEHALKHGSRNGLVIVTLGWFVDSVRRNVRMSESLYTVKNIGEGSIRVDELNQAVGFSGTENSCLPHGIIHEGKKSRPLSSGKTSNKSTASLTLSNQSVYVDPSISVEMRNKVAEASKREGATLLDQWFVGCNASHVVCEGASVQRYLGHSNNLITPLWLLKTAKEKNVQRLVHLSADLARQLGTMIENYHNVIRTEGSNGESSQENGEPRRIKPTQEERQQTTNLAKIGVRNRRGRRMQTCQNPIRPITPSSLLDSICWSISEPTSTATIYTDSVSSEDGGDRHLSAFIDAKADGKDSEASFANLTRDLTESEKNELIFKESFLTILFPIDRFGEMGPSSRTFFRDRGFTCINVLDRIHRFYQENMSDHEVEAAIHTDSRHANRLRSVYNRKESFDRGFVAFKRVDFLGSRRSFEMLKRVGGDNNSNVYELLLRA